MSKTNSAEKGAPGRYKGSALRSMGVLLALIGALLAAHYWFRRRMASEQAWTGSQLTVRARLRLGVRQEVLVVEWGNDQLVLGVGPAFIQPLHICRGAALETEKDREVSGHDE